MRIAHIANMYGPKSGGLKTAVNQLSREYAELGNQVLIVIPGASSSFHRDGNILIAQIKSPQIPFSGGYRVIVKIGTVIEHLGNFQPDVIEISDRTTLLKVANWAKSHSIPTTVFAHERIDGVLAAFLSWMPFRKQIAQSWNKRTINIATRVIATTEYASQEFQDLGHIPSPHSRLGIIPLGVDLMQFNPDSTSKTPATFGLNDPYILACTRLSKEKDPIFLLEIAKELKRREIKTTIVVIGTGPLEGKLREISIRESLNLHFLGFIQDKSDIASLMSAADSFLAVGPIETFGLAALESLACGTPVLCRNSAAIAEVIDSKSGRALSRDAAAWVDTIQEFAEANREDLRVFSRARAETFSWSRCAQSLLELHGSPA